MTCWDTKARGYDGQEASMTEFTGLTSSARTADQGPARPGPGSPKPRTYDGGSPASPEDSHVPSTPGSSVPRPMPPTIGDVVIRAAATIGVPTFLTGPYEDGMPLLWA